MTGLPVELPADAVTIIVDNREPEHTAWNLAPLQMMRGTLATFDYSIQGAESAGGIERKELGDLISCVTAERDRFERELQRMLAYPFRAVIVEASWQQIENGGWRSKVTPESVIGSVLGWQAAGINFLFPGSRAAAEKYAAKMLYIVARRRWREARAFVSGIKAAEECEAANA